MYALPCSRHFVFRKFMCVVLIELFVSRSIQHFSRLHFDTGFEWFGHGYGHREERYFLWYEISLCPRDFKFFYRSQVWLWHLVPIQSFINIVNYYWWKRSSQINDQARRWRGWRGWRGGYQGLTRATCQLDAGKIRALTSSLLGVRGVSSTSLLLHHWGTATRGAGAGTQLKNRNHLVFNR